MDRDDESIVSGATIDDDMDLPTVAPRRGGKLLQTVDSNMGSGTITTVEPSVTIVRGELDGTTTYYKIISTSTPGASSLPIHPHESGMESVGKVQLINGSLHFPNGTVVVPSSIPGEVLNNSLSAIMNPSLLSSHPTMVSVSIPGGSAGARFRSVNIQDTSTLKRKNQTNTRDEKRRQTHNEVERRRRDKINAWITKLQALLPETRQAGDHSKQTLSKGAVLSKAVDHISLLNEQLAQARSVKDTSQKMHLLAIENEVYKKQADVLINYIRAKGMELPANMPTAALNALQELQQGTAILIAQQTRAPGK